MTATVYAINLDYRCNERCVFCAADLGGVVPVEIRRPTLTLDRIREWLDGEVPGPGDRVVLSGGEPTLHRELASIAAHLATGGPEIVLFTNGMRLSDRTLARTLADAGVGRYEISLYGAEAAAHDAMTRRPGSFDRTLQGLRNLAGLREEFGIWIAVRLLVSRGTVAANPDIIRRVARDVGAVDSFSLNHLVLSQDALDADAQVSWAEARASVNECARLVRGLGCALDASTVPLCVFDGDTIGQALQAAVALHAAAGGATPERFRYRYLDPLVPADGPAPRTRAALPDVCVGCRLNSWCVRVERGYLARFGDDGLRTVLPAPVVGR